MKIVTIEKIENKIHMLIDCPFYTDEQVHLLSTILIKYKDTFSCGSNSTEVIVHSINCEYETVSFHLAKFIHKCFNKRMAL